MPMLNRSLPKLVAVIFALWSVGLLAAEAISMPPLQGTSRFVFPLGGYRVLEAGFEIAEASSTEPSIVQVIPVKGTSRKLLVKATGEGRAVVQVASLTDRREAPVTVVLDASGAYLETELQYKTDINGVHASIPTRKELSGLLAAAGIGPKSSGPAPSGELGQVYAGLNQLTEDFGNVEVVVVGSTLLVRGEIDSISALEALQRQLAQIAAAEAPKGVAVMSALELSQLGKNSIASRIERETGSPEIIVRYFRNCIMLEGTAESDFEADRAVALARAYAGRHMPATRGTATQTGETGVSAPGPMQPDIVDLLRVRPPMKRSAGKKK